jgi:hypothetical protein
MEVFMKGSNGGRLRRLVLLAALCCIGLLSGASVASAATQTLTTNVLSGGTNYTHTYAITVACDGSFTGTGTYDARPTSEIITGTIAGGTITASSIYGDGSGYSYSFSAPVDSFGNFTGTSNGTDTLGNTFDVSGTGATVPSCPPPPPPCNKPGNGYGDTNHTHCGPPGQLKKP